MRFPGTESEKTASIDFFSEDIEFDLDYADLLTNWIKITIDNEDKPLHYLNFIFCSDNYLLDINLKYLNHDTFTDVVSFPYSEEAVEGEVFISIDRVRENASDLGIPFAHELYRVMIHGTLHLIGYQDKQKTDKIKMTQLEDHYLELLLKRLPE